MEYKLLGVKFNVINVILCIALGFLICAMLGYNNKKIIEGVRVKRANVERDEGAKKRNDHLFRKSGKHKRRAAPNRHKKRR